jgi:hypothetical protein
MQTAELTFSKHAEQRLAQREIELNDQDIQRLNSAALKAGKKGKKYAGAYGQSSFYNQHT